MLEATTRVGARSAAHPRVVYAYLKHLWYSGHHEAAIEQLVLLTRSLDDHAQHRARIEAAVAAGTGEVTDADVAAVGVYGAHQLTAAEEAALRVQCHLRLGQWRAADAEPLVAHFAGGAAGLEYSDGSGTVGGGGGGGGGGGSDSGARAHRAVSRAASTGSNISGGGGGGGVTLAGLVAGMRPNARMPSDQYAALMAPALAAFRTATHECGEAGFGHYRAWHAWAILNFAAAEHHADNAKVERERERSARLAPRAAVPPSGSEGTSAAPAPVAASPPAPPGRRLSTRADLSPGGVGGSGAGGGAGGGSSTPAPPPPTAAAIAQVVVVHAVMAVKGFFRSIALGRTRLKAYVLQDLLRLLTLWFTHGEAQAVRGALESGLASGAVSIEVWLQVIPQLIARINIRSPGTLKLLQALLTQVGSVHPQALVYPLTVACKSATAERRQAALPILGQMRRRWAKLVDQAEMVSRELIRVAILWHELWNSALEEASRHYFGDGNADAMLATLLPLHEMMSSPGPQTLRERAFHDAFFRDLDAAHRWLVSFSATGRVADLSQAWDIYYLVFRRLGKLLQSRANLELHAVSPVLLAAHDLELCVPGTYHAGAPTVRIMAFCPVIGVLPSKQRPRKVTLLGSDGRQYTFLLKGHEDLRQDERVMQLFGLVNTLLANDGETSRRDLSIRRYAVTPLSHDAGVVGWVPNCDTLHALIRDFRDTRKILLNIEHRLMLQMAPTYDSLGTLQKVEVFRFALESTTGQDLYKVLWLKSASSEVWLDRRTNYVRSLAVMSIVGYILGLGDRHPSNLMLDRVSGKILHIDFGDCFETAMTREKIPERVPFRLTRMLVNAMEVSGIEGNYRSVCEAVMRVLRLHRDSLMAMLEAFVHDPLINWRLLTAAAPGGAAAATAAGAAAAPAGGAAAAPAADGTAGGGGAGGRRRSAVAASSRGGGGAPGGGVPAAAATDADLVARATLQQRGLAFAEQIDRAAMEAAMTAAGVAPEDAAVAAAGVRSGGGGGGGGGVGGGDEAAAAAALATVAVARSMMSSMRSGRGDRERELVSTLGPEGAAAPSEAVNERAVAVIRRIQAKLTGRDFAEDDPIGRMMNVCVGLVGGIGADASPDGTGTLDVAAQVQRLIFAATSHEALGVAYAGWCPWW